MNRFVKLLLAAFSLAIIFSMIGESINAQTMKIGYVRDDRIRTEHKAFQDAQEQFEIEARAWDEEAGDKQQELQELVDEYEKQKLILSDDKRREKEALIRTKQEALDAFTRQIYGPGGTAERKNNQLLQPLLDEINAAIEAVAIEGNYDVIFNVSGLAYIKPDYEVTDKILEYLGKETE